MFCNSIIPLMLYLVAIFCRNSCCFSSVEAVLPSDCASTILRITEVQRTVKIEHKKERKDINFTSQRTNKNGRKENKGCEE